MDIWGQIMELIHDWSDEKREKYGEHVVLAKHRLEETGLFTDERLAQMLDDHPSHLIDFQHIPDNPEYQDQQVTVDFSGADGASMIAAAQSDARIWINVREVMNRRPEYKKVFNQIHEELESLTGKNKDRRNSRGGILISSATAATPYHADPTITHLWHVSGHKKIWVYPRAQKFIPDEAYESIILGEVMEDMPYDPDWDKDAIVSPADLMGGEFIAWPHRAPHRVKNVTFCVSMTMEFSTKQTAFTNAGMFTNGVMRRRLGRNPEWQTASSGEKWVKAATGFTLRHMGTRNKFVRKDMVKFVLDPSTKDWVKPVETPYERVH